MACSGHAWMPIPDGMVGQLPYVEREEEGAGLLVWPPSPLNPGGHPFPHSTIFQRLPSLSPNFVSRGTWGVQARGPATFTALTTPMNPHLMSLLCLGVILGA